MIKAPSYYIKPTYKEKIRYKMTTLKCKLFGHMLEKTTEYSEYDNKTYSLCQRCQIHIAI